MHDVSPNYKGSTDQERSALSLILSMEGTGMAILFFNKLKHVFDDYGYWFILSTLWVSYSGWSDLVLWRQLFSSKRRFRETSIMKPSEYKKFRKLPAELIVYRAHRLGETDWISYTTDERLAKRWAMQRGGYVARYKIKKKDCLALFLRRGENEILMLDPKKAKPLDNVSNSDTKGVDRLG